MPLGLDAEVTADFGEGHLDGSTADEPAKDVERVGIEISAQKSLRLELTGDVANQHIADRREAAWVMPDRGAGNDLPPPVGELLMPSFVLARISFRRCQYSQKWQRPDTPGPGDLRQKHDREPSQAARLDEASSPSVSRHNVKRVPHGMAVAYSRLWVNTL